MSNDAKHVADTAAPIRHEDIIFSSQQTSMSTLLSGLRRKTLTIHNRLKSIQEDADFVESVAQSYGASVKNGEPRKRPLVANERCGSWYIRPALKDGSAYFKSTDGHERAWKFSTRRLNFHIAEMADANDGVIIVDSTRRGKRMPDALSTTIPIWCAVVNRVLLPDHSLSKELFLPPYMSQSIHAQISALIPSFVTSLSDLQISLPVGTLSKPLRPFWVTQDSHSKGDEADHQVIFEDYTPVICCTSSRRVVGSEMDEGGYIQGAGDDTENWAHGLVPVVFWSNVEALLSAAEADLPDTISKLVDEHEANCPSSTTFVSLTPHLSVGTLSQASAADSSACYILLTTQTSPKDTWVKSATRMEVGVGKHKTASRNIRLALGDICNFAANYLRRNPSGQCIVCCESGKDLSIATSLAISCFVFDDNGNIRSDAEAPVFNKTLIKSRLAGFMTTYPAANPSRTTLQSVNSFLMDWRP